MNTDRHSFKSDQTDALSLSVYNVGYEKCQGLHSWGSGVRDHYLIHHIISGKGVYKTPQGEYHLSAGDTFLIYPYTVITYTADKNDPWEYYWAGFNGSDAEFILDRAGFTRECPVISADFGSELKDSLERIYRLSGNRSSDLVKMTGSFTSRWAFLWNAREVKAVLGAPQRDMSQRRKTTLHTTTPLG